MQEFQFQSRSDQWPIRGYRWPRRPHAGVVVISHGLAEHALRYDRFARALNAADYDVWAVDHRGHGQTAGPAGLGDFGIGGWDALVDDLDQVVDMAKADGSGAPLVLFGHSMGAAAAQQYAPIGSEKLTALVLCGSTLRRPDETLPTYNEAFEPARTPYDWLSRDPLEVDKYVADPLCGFEGQTVVNGFDPLDPRRVDIRRLSRIRGDLPVLLVAGDADPVNGNLRGIEFLESRWREAGVQQIERQIYPGARHELLNESNRQEVTDNIIRWLARTIRGQRSADVEYRR